MKTAIADMLGDKSFLTAFVAVVVGLGAHFGLHLDPAITATFVGTFAAVIVKQALEAHGNDAAQTNAAAAVPNLKAFGIEVAGSSELAKAPQKGSIRLGLAVGVAIVGVIACSAADRRSTIEAAYTATLAAGSALATFDGGHEQDIVVAAPSKAAADAALAAWQAERLKVRQALEVALQTEIAAALANDSTTLATMAGAVSALVAELKADGVSLP